MIYLLLLFDWHRLDAADLRDGLVVHSVERLVLLHPTNDSHLEQRVGILSQHVEQRERDK